MTTEELKNCILELIEMLYHKRYIGKLWVTKLEPVGYKVVFGLNNVERPITISAEMHDKPFLKFVKDELLNRRFDKVEYFEGYKTFPN
mgnify:CR=1 FL=1|jgi:hypothetical protein